MTPEEYRAQVADSMSEAALLAQVTTMARQLGWLAYHTHRSDRSPAGFPDLCLVHPRAGRLIFAELKRQKRSNPTPAQVEWLDGVNAVSDAIASDYNLLAPEAHGDAADGIPTRVIAVLWRPRDLLDGIVESMLRVSE